MRTERPPTTRRTCRTAATAAGAIDIRVDGEPVSAMPGDTLLVAVLATRGTLRRSRAAGEMRAGFCLMGACQECWLWLEDGRRLRACTTPVEAGMRVWSTAPPDWPMRPPAGAP